jgi:predicted TPR repeat methyltransferase
MIKPRNQATSSRIATETGRGDTTHYFKSGNALRREGRYPAAIDAYRKGLLIDRYDYRIASNLAALHVQQGDFLKAYDVLCQAKADSHPAPFWFNLGFTAEKSGSLEQAIEAYQTALRLDPLHSDSLKNLAGIAITLQKRELAVSCYKTLREIHPDSDTNKYFLNILEQRLPSRAPPEYVTDLFDQYAETYDRHLEETLGSRCAEYVANKLKNLCDSRGGVANILDLGCGTGLVGRHLKALNVAARISGVDLSTEMLKHAAKLDIYSSLTHADIEEYLRQTSNTLDFIVASDTFNYFGNLEPVLKASADRLAPHGYLVFTVEAGESLEAQMNGRFRHTLTYLETTARVAGLSLVDASVVELRRERAAAVKGWVVVLHPGQNPHISDRLDHVSS